MPGDFLPGYVSTITSAEFKNILDNIVVIGQDDGKIYGKFNDKNELFQKIRLRKNRSYMMCYYQNNVVFTEIEKELLWNKNIFPISKKEAERIKLVNLFI